MEKRDWRPARAPSAAPHAGTGVISESFLVSGVQQSDSLTGTFSRFFSTIGDYKILNIFACAVE